MKSQFTYLHALHVRVLCMRVYVCVCVLRRACAAVADVFAMRCGRRCRCRFPYELHIYFAFCSIYMKIILIMRLAFDAAQRHERPVTLVTPTGRMLA